MKGVFMPKKKKFQKEEIVDAAYEIVKMHGLNQLNARRLAKKLNCSV